MSDPLPGPDAPHTERLAATLASLRADARAWRFRHPLAAAVASILALFCELLLAFAEKQTLAASVHSAMHDVPQAAGTANGKLIATMLSSRVNAAKVGTRSARVRTSNANPRPLLPACGEKVGMRGAHLPTSPAAFPGTAAAPRPTLSDRKNAIPGPRFCAPYLFRSSNNWLALHRSSWQEQAAVTRESLPQ